MQREIKKLFEDDDRSQLWSHLSIIHKLAEGKVAAIKARQRPDFHLLDRWYKAVHVLKAAADGIKNI